MLVETATACRHTRTADLVESLTPDAVAVLGDNQYEHGELANFTAVFEPTWGRFRQITHPAVGNHEYEGDSERDEAPGYYSYFGAAAGDPAKGYYRWEFGGWTILVLNSGAINWTRATGASRPCPTIAGRSPAPSAAPRNGGCAPSSRRSRAIPV